MSYGGTDYIKTNKWRYVRDTNTSRRMLYNIETDPYEFTNLYSNSQYASVITQLTTQLDSMIAIGSSMKAKLLANYSFVPKALTIPGIIEAEDYDEGGYKQTYYDADRVNSGGKYRTGDGTDIYITDDTNGSFHLSELAAGDWCAYTITDFTEGRYAVDVRVKNTSEGVIQLYNGSELLAEKTIIPSYGSWQTIRISDVTITKHLSTRLRFKIKSGTGIQINWLAFESINTANPEIRANKKRKCLDSNVVTNNIILLNLQNTDPLAILAIYDLKGNLISRQQVSGEQSLAYQLPVVLEKGMYLLRISDENAWSVEKFIIK